MAIGPVITEGFGAIGFAGIKYLPTLGYIASTTSLPIPPIVTTGYGVIGFAGVKYLPTLGYLSNSVKSTGAIIFDLTGDSNTTGTVLAYNDGTINIPNIMISNDTMPIRRACIDIIQTVGMVGGVWIARPYKLAVKKNGVIILTVRSLYFGTKLTLDESSPDFIVLDHPEFEGVLG